MRLFLQAVAAYLLVGFFMVGWFVTHRTYGMEEHDHRMPLPFLLLWPIPFIGAFLAYLYEGVQAVVKQLQSYSRKRTDK